MNPLTKDPLIEKLKRRQGPFRRFFNALGPTFEREPGHEETVTDIHNHVVASDPLLTRFDVIKVLKAMDDEGLGAFTTGRKGKESRFAWGQLRLAGGQRFSPPPGTMGFMLSSSAQVPGPLPRPTAPPSTTRKIHTINCLLREDFPVVIDLPGDLTAAEASRLSRIIMALPATES